MKIYKLFALPALLLGIVMMARAGYQLFQTEQARQEGSAVYGDLSGQVKKNAAAPPSAPSVTGTPPAARDESPDGAEPRREEEARMDIPGFEIDFEALRTVSPDAAAWLYSPDTAIDYPVMKADDYSYYLTRLPDGRPNAGGSLFLDYHCAPDFRDPLTVIYGHHMKSGSMFGSLQGYKKQAYFEEHPVMYLYTEAGNYRIELLYGVLIGAGQWRERAFMHAENLESLLRYAARNTTFVSEAGYQDGDRFAALSTCSYEFDDARYVVIGVLRPEAPDRP